MSLSGPSTGRRFPASRARSRLLVPLFPASRLREGSPWPACATRAKGRPSTERIHPWRRRHARLAAWRADPLKGRGRMDLGTDLKTETVSRLHPTQAWLVQLRQPVSDAIKLMREKKVGCVLVCEQRRIVGIFTERDLLRRVMAQGKPLDTS